MSLQAAAQHLSNQGRGPDNTLVHMSRGEVKSLNDLAMAHGGHLTINPQTGLPEAGFLSKLLPMLAGGALAMIPGVGPIMAASLVGGGTAIATGSLEKGLMAGLGAYGGADLASSLTSAGAASVVPKAAAAAPTAAAAAPTAVNPLAGLDVSGATTAGFSPAATGAATAAPTAVVPTGAGPLSGLDVSGATTAGLPPTTMAPPTPTAVQPNMATNAPGTWSTNPADYETFSAKANTPGAFGEAPLKLHPENMTASQRFEAMKNGASFDNVVDYATKNPYTSAAMAASLYTPKKEPEYEPDADMGQRYSYSADPTNPLPSPDSGGREQTYFTPRYTKISDEEARSIYGYAGGGPVETMSNLNGMGMASNYPLANVSRGPAQTMYQPPMSSSVVTGGATDTAVNPMTGEMAFARGGLSSAASHLGDYSDGGRLLRGPGDGVSDSIPAMIGRKQPARLADGEFVVPARIVSELGNGSTEAGARKLYAMMDRVQASRKKSIGKGKVAKNSRASKYLPA
jgi:hypothetical protein